MCAANLASRNLHVTGRSSNDTSCSPPLGDTLKINVDAHLRRDGRWSSGLILKRSDGSIVGAATRSHVGSSEPTFGEAMGLNDALDRIHSARLEHIYLKSNLKSPVQAF
jgi:hypothetical protein